MRFSKLIIFSLIASSLFSPPLAFAQVNNLTASDSAVINELQGIKLNPGVLEIGTSRISPGSPWYFLKAAREKIERNLALTPEVQRIRVLEFAGRRLREVKSLINTPRESLIESTLVHYRDSVDELDKKTAKTEDLQVWATEGLGEHLDIMLSIYPQIHNLNAKRSLRATIELLEEHNRLLVQKLTDQNQKKALVDRITLTQATVCNFYAKELNSPELNDVERYVLSSRLQKCTESIRGELSGRLEQIKQEQNSHENY